MKIEVNNKEYNMIVGALGAILAFCSDVSNKHLRDTEVLYGKLLKLKLDEVQNMRSRNPRK